MILSFCGVGISFWIATCDSERERERERERALQKKRTYSFFLMSY
jgi:hypothetical protein